MLTYKPELNEDEIVRLIQLLNIRMMEIRRQDPDGPNSKYPDIVLYLKLLKLREDTILASKHSR